MKIVPVQLKPGVAFWPKGLPGQKTHAWVLLSAPVDGCVLAVNFTDLEHDLDAECIVRKNDGIPWITKDSFVFFAEHEELPCRKMPLELGAQRLVVHLSDVPAEIMERILQAARATPHILEKTKQKYGLMRPNDKTTAPF